MSLSCQTPGFEESRGGRSNPTIGRGGQLSLCHFRLYIALRWEVTVTFCVPKSSLGAGPVSGALAAIGAALIKGMGRGCWNVSTAAYHSSPRLRPLALATAPASSCARRRAVFHGLNFCRVHVGQVLCDGADFGKIPQLDCDICFNAVADQLALGILVIVHGIDREHSHLGLLGIDAVSAEKLAELFSGLRCLCVGSLQIIFLRRDVELHQGSVGLGLVLTVGSYPNRVRNRRKGGVLREHCDGGSNQEDTHCNGCKPAKWLHGFVGC